MTHPILRHTPPAGAASATVPVPAAGASVDDAAATVYSVKVPTRRDKIEFRAELTRQGLRYPSDAELRAVLRQDLVDNAQGWEDLVAVVDAFAEQQDALAERSLEYAAHLATLTDEAARETYLASVVDDPSAPSIDPDLARQYAVIEADVRRNCEPFRQLEAERARFSALLSLTTTALFLVGWTNGQAPFRREDGRVPDDLLDRLPDADLMAIHTKVIELMGVGAAAAKNSGSRSGSSSGRATSTSGRKRRTARPGKSTGSSIRSTRATKSTKAG